MGYSVKLTANAVAQLSESMAYISKVLLAPDTAISWADHLKKAISGLDTLPLRFPLIDVEPWSSKGIRKMPVKNYIVYYLVDETDKTVWVTAVVYSRRDQLSALKDMP